MTTLLFAVGTALAIAGLVVFPVAAHVMLEGQSPRSWKRLGLSLVAILVNFGSVILGVTLVWIACTR